MVSIIMPVFNASDFLKECLDSITSQDYQNWELIAVDDFSDDGSLEILEKYAKDDSRIQIFRNTKKGITPALKLAYSKSKGSFITRMDADDVMSIDKIRLLRETFEEDSKHLATAYVKYFSNEELGEGFKNYEKWLNLLVDNQSHFQEIYKECVIPSPCWMMNRESFDGIGAFDSETYPEDYDLCFRMYAKGLNIVPIKKTLHYWRDYSNRTSRIDSNYADNNFLKMKCDYFLDIDHEESKDLVIWGAGKKGKEIAKILNRKGIKFDWICNNPNKIGHRIENVILKDSNLIQAHNSPQQVIVSVANQSEQNEIRQIIGKSLMIDAFWFC